MPRGFETYAQSPVEDVLRLKGIVAARDVDEAAVRSPGFTEDVVAFAQDVMPLLAWGWAVVDGA